MASNGTIKIYSMRDWIVLLVGGVVLSETIRWFGREVFKDLFFGTISDWLRPWLAKMIGPSAAQLIASSLLPYLLGFCTIIFVAWWFGRGRNKERQKVSLWLVGMVLFGLGALVCVAGWLNSTSIQVSALSAEFDRYLKPRHLTEVQITTIGEYLKKFSPQDYDFLLRKNSQEVGMYRVDIQKALTLGGWNVTNFTYSEDVPEGLSYRLKQVTASREAGKKNKNFQPNQIFSEAFEHAGLGRIGGQAGGGSSTEEDKFIITIGTRRMDDADLLSEQREIERAREVLGEK